jgi:predicted RNA-binding protein with PUA-like domain
MLALRRATSKARRDGPRRREHTMARSYWLMKSEPFKYAWSELVSDGWTYWDGVRNYEARNNLAAMKVGDLSLYYHSNEGKEVVGVARVIKQAYQDPTTDDDRWVVVDVEPVVPFERPVTLAEIKGEPRLANIKLIRRGRLSVVGIESDEFEYILKLGKTKLPRVASKGAEKKSAKKGARKPAKKPPKKKAAAKK